MSHKFKNECTAIYHRYARNEKDKYSIDIAILQKGHILKFCLSVLLLDIYYYPIWSANETKAGHMILNTTFELKLNLMRWPIMVCMLSDMKYQAY